MEINFLDLVDDVFRLICENNLLIRYALCCTCRNLFRSLQFKYNQDLILSEIVTAGDVSMLRWTAEECHSTISPSLADLASEMGRVAILEYFRKKNLPMNQSMVLVAINTGQVEVVKWMDKVNPLYLQTVSPAVLHLKACSSVAMIEFLSMRGYLKWVQHNMLQHAIDSDNPEVYKWVVTKYNIAGIAQANSWDIRTACELGKLEILKLFPATEIFYPHNSYLRSAIESGHTEIVEYLFEIGNIIVTEELGTLAIKAGSIDILKFFVERGLRVTEHLKTLARKYSAKYGRMGAIIFSYLDNRFLAQQYDQNN
jgi:hypothetical protein